MFDGGCTCRSVRYHFDVAPLVVHCCHCRWCQRETGSAFALNALIERSRVQVEGATELILTPTLSGKGQKVYRCPTCKIAIFSHYGGAGDAIAFIRIGTLDEPDRLPPDVHIFTMSKQPWVVLPDGAKAFPEFYNAKEVLPKESLERWALAKARS
jgi:hypothetical protein